MKVTLNITVFWSATSRELEVVASEVLYSILQNRTLIHMCISTLRHIHDCNLQHEAVNFPEMLVRYCVLPRQKISGHSSTPSPHLSDHCL